MSNLKLKKRKVIPRKLFIKKATLQLLDLETDIVKTRHSKKSGVLFFAENKSYKKLRDAR